MFVVFADTWKSHGTTYTITALKNVIKENYY